IAKKWEAKGAEWIHIIDLDGAFEKYPKNFHAIYYTYPSGGSNPEIDYFEAHLGLTYNLGTRLRNRPSRNADRSLLWWSTAEGWIGTASLEDIPDSGVAYLTERMATPWTLTFLESLTRNPPMPVWRSG
ncbi:MAG: hypothetical protein GWP18_03365, partial [Proteobacteria bacterium]|nr:hypothetical protein [Pseudomonadota bacterium]